MGTSPITPCYDVERLETNTHVGLGPGESIEYTKHRVSLEGHPWPGCHPEETPGIHIVMDRPSKEAIRLDIGRSMAWAVALVASRARSVVLLRSLREAESRLASSLASILAWKT